MVALNPSRPLGRVRTDERVRLTFSAKRLRPSLNPLIYVSCANLGIEFTTSLSNTTDTQQGRIEP